MRARAGFRGKDRRGFNSLVIGTAWALWKQRNARVFHRLEQFNSPAGLTEQILDEIKYWNSAGVGDLFSLSGVGDAHFMFASNVGLL